MILQWIQAILCYTERGVFGGVSKRLWNVVCVVFDGTNIPWKVAGLFWWRLLHVLSACVNFAPQASFSEGGVRRDWELSTQWLVSLSLNLLAESLWLRLQVPASVNHFAVHILFFFFFQLSLYWSLVCCYKYHCFSAKQVGCDWKFKMAPLSSLWLPG